MKVQFERLTTLITIFTIVTIVFGYGSLYLYYYKWNIAISSFIDVSEILIAFTSYYFEFICLLLCYFLFVGFLVLLHKKEEKLKEGKGESDKQEFTSSNKLTKIVSFINGKVTYSFLRLLPFLLMLVYFLLLYSYFNFKNLEANKNYTSIFELANALGVVFYFVPLLAVFIFVRFYMRMQNIEMIFYYSTLIFGLVYFYIMIDTKFILTKYKIITQDIELTLDENQLINTKTDSLTLVGQTRNYIFFSANKEKDKSIIVIPVSRVKRQKIILK